MAQMEVLLLMAPEHGTALGSDHGTDGGSSVDGAGEGPSDEGPTVDGSGEGLATASVARRSSAIPVSSKTPPVPVQNHSLAQHVSKKSPVTASKGSPVQPAVKAIAVPKQSSVHPDSAPSSATSRSKTPALPLPKGTESKQSSALSSSDKAPPKSLVSPTVASDHEEPCTSGLQTTTKHTGPKLQSSITPVLLKQLSDRLDSLEANSKTARKRKCPLSSAVFALTSKRWKQLIDEEKAEKEKQKLLNKKGKQKLFAKGKGKQKKGVDMEKEADDNWNSVSHLQFQLHR